MEYIDFKSIKTTVENDFPNPIATIFRKARVLSSDDLGGRHKTYIDLFEVTVKFLCILMLQELNHHYPNFKELLPQKEKSLEFLKRPSIGGWVGLLRTLSNLNIDNKNLEWYNKIAEWYNSAKNEQLNEILKKFDAIEGLNFNRKSKTPNAEVLNILVTYRNKQIAHGASMQDDVLRERLYVLESTLSYLLNSIQFLSEIELFHTKRIEINENKEYLISGSILKGQSYEPVEIISESQLEKSELYVLKNNDAKFQDKDIIPLTPFILWEFNESNNMSEIYFYNDAWKTKLEFISYNSGAFYYHKELHESFSSFLILKLSPGAEEDLYKYLTPYERSEKSESLLKRAMILKNQAKYEEAIETFEHALEYERKGSVFEELVKTQILNQEPKEVIFQTIQNGLEIDNKNEYLSQTINQIDDNNQFIEKATKNSDTITSLFHAVLPPRFRHFTTVIWLFVFFTLSTFSIIIEFYFGNTRYIPVAVIYFFILIFLDIGHIYLLNMYRKIELQLSLQIETMSLVKFQKWYKLQLQYIFGTYYFTDERLNMRKSFHKSDFIERVYIISYPLLAFTATILLLLISQSFKEPFIVIIKRFFELMFLVLVISPVVRYVIVSPVFVYKFSRISLKPILSKLNNDGIKSFGQIITFNTIVAALGFSLGLIAASFFNNDPNNYFDLVFIFAATLLFICISILMPLMLKGAAAAAKQKSISKYTEHIEDAYRAFLSDPAEDNLERYNWLLKKQNVIKRITTWPLNIKQTIALFFGNLVLLVSITVYLFFRIGLIDSYLINISAFYKSIINLF